MKNCWRSVLNKAWHNLLFTSARHGGTFEEDIDETGSMVSSCAGTIVRSPSVVYWRFSQLFRSLLTAHDVAFFLFFYPQMSFLYDFHYSGLVSRWILFSLYIARSLSLSLFSLCSSSVTGSFVFGFPIERNAALKQLVSTSTVVFLSSAAGSPTATAAALLPFSDGRNNATGNRPGQHFHNRKYPLLKRDSSVSLESASALINSYGSV